MALHFSQPVLANSQKTLILEISEGVVFVADIVVQYRNSPHWLSDYDNYDDVATNRIKVK